MALTQQSIILNFFITVVFKISEIFENASPNKSRKAALNNITCIT